MLLSYADNKQKNRKKRILLREAGVILTDNRQKIKLSNSCLFFFLLPRQRKYLQNWTGLNQVTKNEVNAHPVKYLTKLSNIHLQKRRINLVWNVVMYRFITVLVNEMIPTQGTKQFYEQRKTKRTGISHF